MPSLIARLVGVNFYSKALQIKSLIEAGHPLLLVREPDNPHDPNAIEVYIKLGHIDRKNAEFLSSIYDDQNSRSDARVCIRGKLCASDQIEVECPHE